MRHSYLVTYDVSDDKRLRQVFRCMNGYGDPVQYSVFRCDLSDHERVLMVAALTEMIHHQEDQVLIYNLGPVDGRRACSYEVLGRPSPPPLRGTWSYKSDASGLAVAKPPGALARQALEGLQGSPKREMGSECVW